MSVAIPSISPAIKSMGLTSINTIRTLSMDAVQAANYRAWNTHGAGTRSGLLD